jgi:hypothetical protein
MGTFLLLGLASAVIVIRPVFLGVIPNANRHANEEVSVGAEGTSFAMWLTFWGFITICSLALSWWMWRLRKDDPSAATLSQGSPTEDVAHKARFEAPLGQLPPESRGNNSHEGEPDA